MPATKKQCSAQPLCVVLPEAVPLKGFDEDPPAVELFAWLGVADTLPFGWPLVVFEYVFCEEGIGAGTSGLFPAPLSVPVGIANDVRAPLAEM